MRQLIFFVVLFALWLLLVGEVPGRDPGAAFVGFALALLIAVIFGSVFMTEPKRVFAPRRWLLFLCYVPYFLYYCIRANLDVAYRVIHPDLPIRPAIVKVRTRLTTDLAKTFLANSITLTPGTLTVDIQDQDFYIHCINVPEKPEDWSRRIVERFEPLLAEIFE